MEKKVPEKSKKERKKEKQCFTKTGSKCWRSSFCRPVPEGNRSEWLGNLQLGRQLPACDVHQDPGQEGRLLSGGHSWAGGLPEEEELPGACWPGHPAHTLPHCLWACGRWRRGAWRSGDPHAAGGPFFILAFTYIYLWIFFYYYYFVMYKAKLLKFLHCYLCAPARLCFFTIPGRVPELWHTAGCQPGRRLEICGGQRGGRRNIVSLVWLHHLQLCGQSLWKSRWSDSFLSSTHDLDNVLKF